jgi:hypothetical protein
MEMNNLAQPGVLPMAKEVTLLNSFLEKANSNFGGDIEYHDLSFL